MEALIAYSYRPGLGNEKLLFAPVVFTVKDTTSERTLGAFTIDAGLSECVLVQADEGATVTYMGQAYPHSSPACAVSRTSVPASDRVTVVARFAGSANYAPSVSHEEVLVGLEIH
jgi:hypothetical protein